MTTTNFERREAEKQARAQARWDNERKRESRQDDLCARCSNSRWMHRWWRRSSAYLPVCQRFLEPSFELPSSLALDD